MQQHETFRSLGQSGWDALGSRNPEVPPIYIDFRIQRPDRLETNDLINKVLIKFERFGYTISFGDACDRVWFYTWDIKSYNDFAEWLDLMEVKFN